jgi:pyruvate ferredoxin oxidoreductase alpha subunit
MIKVISGNEAAAHGVRLVQPAVMTAYPITPASRISEQIAEFAAAGLLKGKFVNVESEMSSLGIVTGASNAGVRVFTATASQGLAWMQRISSSCRPGRRQPAARSPRQPCLRLD